jgi:DNA polymerase (family 10)
VNNTAIARIFDEIADLLELQGANPFRIRAYRNAARMLGTMGTLGRSVATMVERHENLDSLPGIGPDLAGKIGEIVATGSYALLERLRADVPAELGTMLRSPNLGPKRVRALHDELGVRTLEQLHAAAQAGRIQTVHGFGPRLQQQILAATRTRPPSIARIRLDAAEAAAQPLLARLRGLRGVVRAEVAGSLRRRKDSIGDLDLLVQSARGKQVVDAFVHHDDVREVLAADATRASVKLKGGLQVDLRIVPSASFGAAWLYFTGSKAHHIALRRLAQQRGLKINEYGVFRGSEKVAGRDEAARRGRLPVLIELDLDDSSGMAAKAEGVLISINADAHSAAELDHLRFGIGRARRAWLQATDVLNARPLEALRPLLARTM